TLTVNTYKAGAAAKAGHDLEMVVERWSATLEVGPKPVLTVSADPNSFRVVKGSGGVKPLSDEEREAIPLTIEEEVLKGTPIEFESKYVDVEDDGNRLVIEGQLLMW